MCGLSGIILGKKRRSTKELTELKDMFRSMLSMSEDRGRHASGFGVINNDGFKDVYKLPVPASRLVTLESFNKLLNKVNSKTTLIIGHSRWKTVGTEFNINNNQPIELSSVVGTHNGTISNATSLFKKFKLNRTAEVDSEVLFRLAEMNMDEDDELDVDGFVRNLSLCHGSLSCVFASAINPTMVYVCKGNKPFYAFYNEHLKAIAYGSNPDYILKTAKNVSDWCLINLEEFNMYVFNTEDFNSILRVPFTLSKDNEYPLLSCMATKPKTRKALT